MLKSHQIDVQYLCMILFSMIKVFVLQENITILGSYLGMNKMELIRKKRESIKIKRGH